jgi:CRISPR system Cascade subunit CasD
MPQYLMLRLDGPMVAFGEVMVDRFGPIRDTPSLSAITGLVGNALGWRREDGGKLSGLQARLVFGTRIDRVESRITDFQTAQLGADDRWWTTSGVFADRAGGAATYDSPHLRARDYDVGVQLTLAMRLEPIAQDPTLAQVAAALLRPARPLFLGRKSCLPAAPLHNGFVEADSAFAALRGWPLPAGHAGRGQESTDPRRRFVLPSSELCPAGFREVTATECRDWVAGVHAGIQRRFFGVAECSSAGEAA